MKSASSPSCAEKLKVLADPTRLAVIQSLMKRPKHVNELMAALDIEQSLLSHHLAQLRTGGFVEAIRDGKAVLYRLTRKMTGEASGRGLDLGCCRLTFPPSKRRT